MSESPMRIGADHTDFDGGPVEPTARVDLFAPVERDETLDEVSAMDALRKALSTPAVSEPVTLRIPARPGVTIRCHTHFTEPERKAWQKRATKKVRGIGKDPEVDAMLFAQLVIANTCEAVQFGGVDAHDAEGTPLTFKHAQLWEMVGAKEPQDAIRNLFARDPHILLASGEVLLAAGFDDDLSVDPLEEG